MVKILFVSFKEPIYNETWQHHLSLLPLKLKEKALRFKRWQDQHSFVLGKLLILKGLNEYSSERFNLDELKYNNYGKPYTDLGIYFNLSHSGDFVMCAFSLIDEIGLDIEEIKPIEFTEFKNIFSIEEFDYINKSVDPLNTFYRFWTIKECLVKGEGRGLSIPLNEINVLDSDFIKFNNNTWYIRQIEGFSGYCCSFVTKQKGQYEICEVPISFITDLAW